METSIIPSSEIPVRTLAEELQGLSGTKERKFLLFRIAGLNVQDSLTFTRVKIGSYNKWLEKPVFNALNLRRTELEKYHRAEAVKLLRRENQLGAVVIEERIIEALMAELDSGEYNLMKTPIAKTVYDKLMQDIDAMPILNVKKLSFIDKMAILMGGQSGNSEAENNQPAQQGQSQPFKELTQRVDQIQEDYVEKGIIDNGTDIVVEGEIIEGQVVNVTFIDPENKENQSA